jgi:PKD repeat protein
LRSSNGCIDVLTKEVDVKQEAIAQFTAADVCEDSAVNFINTSQDAMDYEWKFGDGQSDTGQSPKHLYLISGVTSTFNVSLIASVPAGCSDTFTGAVTINANPKSDFNFTTGGNQVNFTAVEIGASNYQWTFGDGGTTNTTIQTTQYTYSKFPSGKYTACLKVSNIAGCNSQTCKEINITGAYNPIVKQQGIKIYPNPNTGSFTVETNEAKGNLSIEIYDAIGQMVHKVETFQSSTTFNLKLAEGIYLVRVINESEVYLERVVVGR